MRILSSAFVQAFWGRLINIHPSLLPNYPGLDTHQRVLTAKESNHGCSVHFVTDELDGGPIIARASLAILPDDSEDSLKQRVLAFEHQLYPFIVQLFAEKRLQLTPSGVTLDDQLLPKEGFLYE
jgi:phosphoribosylglycinamide formyltransferase-1